MWTQLLENPHAVDMFTVAPSLENVILRRLALDRDGPTITLTVQLRDFPENPPAKWRIQAHDAVSVDVQAMGVKEFTASGWTADSLVSISIERMATGALEIVARGPSVNLYLSCGWVRIVAVTPFQRGVGANLI